MIYFMIYLIYSLIFIEHNLKVEPLLLAKQEIGVLVQPLLLVTLYIEVNFYYDYNYDYDTVDGR